MRNNFILQLEDDTDIDRDSYMAKYQQSQDQIFVIRLDQRCRLLTPAGMLAKSSQINMTIGPMRKPSEMALHCVISVYKPSQDGSILCVKSISIQTVLHV